MPWLTRAGRGRPVEHRSKAAAERAVDEARTRYRNGVVSLRLVRVTDPDGTLTIIDFEAEAANEQPLLRGVLAAAAERTATRVAAEQANTAWRDEIRKAHLAGAPLRDLARAAGTTPEHIRILITRPTSA